MLTSDQISGLKSLPILTGLSDTAVRRIAETCQWRRFDDAQQIVGYQEPSTNVFFLLSGAARAIIYSPQGKAVIFADLKATTMFGEIAAIDRKSRSASVEALGPCTVGSLTAEQFEALMLREPSVAVAVLRHVTAEVRRLSERVYEFSTLAVQNRIHAELLRLAREAAPIHDRVVLVPAPSLAEIANRISTHREAVSRELSRLMTLGLLRREDGSLVIANTEKLAEFVHMAKGD